MTKNEAKNLKSGDRVAYKEDGRRATVKTVSTYGGGYVTLDVEGRGDAILHILDAVECLSLVRRVKS